MVLCFVLTYNKLLKGSLFKRKQEDIDHNSGRFLVGEVFFNSDLSENLKMLSSVWANDWQFYLRSRHIKRGYVEKREGKKMGVWWYR